MFQNYPLHERVNAALSKKGFDTPTPIQAETLPHSLLGRDILGQARTGTGKTLAFGLPIATKLEPDKTKGRAPRAFILTPTRELALQVAGELSWLAPHLTVVTVYGGTGYGKQAADLKRGCDVVVATPGRAIDYLKQAILKLNQVEIAVLDEADEMLSMGFEEDVETLLEATPAERQTLLFSATLPSWAKKLSRTYLRDPIHANVIQDEEVSYQEIAIEANLKNRPGILSDILHAHHGKKTIIFTQTKAETDELAKALSVQGHSAEAINGDLNQGQRERVISRFRSGQVTTLIGTNVAARGLDIPEVDLVVHYRLPNDPEAYQHRSGRTGRAGRSGTVILLHGPREQRELSQLEHMVERRFERATPPSPDAIQQAKLSNLLKNAQAQSAKDKEAWLEVATDLLAAQDTDTVAGLLALILGGAPAPRSLLTGEDNWVTLELRTEIANPGQVMRVMKDAGASEVGRIALARDAAYADVRPDDVSHVCMNNGMIRKARTAPVQQPERSERKPARSQGGKRRMTGSRR